MLCKVTVACKLGRAFSALQLRTDVAPCEIKQNDLNLTLMISNRKLSNEIAQYSSSGLQGR